jgi:plastocyanin
VKRRLTVGAALAAGALATLPAAAPAATQTVFAQDSGGQLVWNPAALSIRIGDTVEWSMAQATGTHDLWVVPPGVDVHDTANQEAYPVKFPGDAPYSRRFETAGDWFYYCSLHGGREPGGMNGTIAVAGSGTGPSGGAPGRPVSNAPAPALNDWTAPATLEEGDNTAPLLTAVAVKRAGRGARVSFTVSEPGSVSIRLARKGRTVKAKRVRVAAAGTQTVLVRAAKRLKAGRYAVRVRAADAAANESRPARLELTIKR